MTALRFPAEISVGEVWWEDVREPGGSGHLLAIGVVEVPDGTAVRLSAYTVAEVSVFGWQAGIFEAPAGTGPGRRSRSADFVSGLGVMRGTGDGRGLPGTRECPIALRNTRSIWGGPGRQATASGAVRRPWTWSSSAICPRTASTASA